MSFEYQTRENCMQRCTHTFNPASPESVYSFNMVFVDPPAPAARADEGLGAAGARRLEVSAILAQSMDIDVVNRWGGRADMR